MSRWSVLHAVTAAVLIVAAPALAKVDLRPRNTEGTVVSFDLTTRSTQTSTSTKIPGGSATQQHSQSVRMRIKVTKVSEAGSTLEVNFERIRYDLEPGMGAPPVQFDSEQPETSDADNPLAQGLRPVLNKPFIVSVAPNGEVTNVVVPAALDDLIKAGTAAGTFVNPDMVKSSLAAIVALPGTPGDIAVGDTWTTVASEPLHLRNTAVVSSTMTLRSADDGVAEIDVTGAMRVEGPNGMKPVAVSVNESSSGGSITWSLTDGFVIRSVMDETAEIEGEPEPNFQIKVRTVSHSEVSRVQ